MVWPPKVDPDVEDMILRFYGYDVWMRSRTWCSWCGRSVPSDRVAGEGVLRPCRQCPWIMRTRSALSRLGWR